MPVTVNPVTSEKFHTVPLFPVTVIPGPHPPIVNARVAVPEVATRPAVKFLLFRSSVPFVRVTVRELSNVRASCNCQVPPTPLNVIGKFTVTPFVVRVFVPDVLANVITGVPDVVVIPEANVKFPYMDAVAQVRLPAPNPVKSRFIVLPSNATISDPAVTLIFRALVDMPEPPLIVLVPVDPLYVKLTVGVPV